VSAAPTPFQAAVIAVLSGLRAGDVMSYGEVAREAGCGSPRAVGQFLAQQGDEHPWWRVVMADRKLAPGKEAEQGRRLRAEGVTVVDDRVVPAG